MECANGAGLLSEGPPSNTSANLMQMLPAIVLMLVVEMLRRMSFDLPVLKSYRPDPHGHADRPPAPAQRSTEPATRPAPLRKLRPPSACRYVEQAPPLIADDNCGINGVRIRICSFSDSEIVCSRESLSRGTLTTNRPAENSFIQGFRGLCLGPCKSRLSRSRLRQASMNSIARSLSDAGNLRYRPSVSS